MALKAIISGGGIGGLTTATALAQRGWDVSVYESQPQLRVNGSGIYTWSNGLQVLRELGAYERAMQNPFKGLGIEQRDHNEEVILPPHLPAGVEVVTIHRADLLAALEGAARKAGVRIETGKNVVDAASDGTFRLANGDRVAADLAIGCDGVNSPVRAGLGIELFHERTAEGALRTTVLATQDEFHPDDRNRCIENWNGKRRLLVTPINDKEVYLALCCPEVDSQARDIRVLPVWAESFPHWKFLLDRIEAEVTWNVYSVIKCKAWSSGHSCVLGDAAHAQPPNLGQGGGMAMQNGLALAAYMANVNDARDVPTALAAWEAAMRPLVDTTQHWAILFGELANIPNEFRPEMIRNIVAHPFIDQMLGLAAGSTPISAVPTPSDGSAVTAE
ncbi:FAD-dependent oxidoreductase [Novosphingobium naphthalenivorans]|uniref:FAD-dependent oxidoreductase n=1 Tax=Novosphingobium naphthalenivorans TaxID=273168 RepID=UPI000A062FF8|nr:NAD(P)/FAD-dependent oxidoreductase [Novosphingobium naphthalenivorans]